MRFIRKRGCELFNIRRKTELMNYKADPELLKNRTVLVTGAGDGIGKIAAQSFAKHGANVILLGKTRTKLESVFDTISSETNTNPIIVQIDLANAQEEQFKQLTVAIEREFGRLDGLLHNASILGSKVPIESYDTTSWKNVLDVNLNAAFILTRELLPVMRKSRDASIIFTSSGVGRKGRAFWGAYAVSKFAIEGLAEVLAQELENTSNIRVNSLNPGGTRTKMRAQAYPAEDPGTLPMALQHMALYLYLIGPDSKGITGEKFDAKTWEGF